MNRARIEIANTTLEELTHSLIALFHFEFVRQTNNMAVLAREDFYFRAFARQLNVLVLTYEDEVLSLEIVAGREGDFIFRAIEKIESFCKEKSFSYKRV